MKHLILFLFTGLYGLYAQPSTCITPELDSLIKELNRMELQLNYDKNSRFSGQTLVTMEEPYYTQMIADSLAIWMPKGSVGLNDEIKFMRARPIIDVIIKLLDSERYYVDYAVGEDYEGNKHTVRKPPVYQRHSVLNYLMEVTNLPIARKGAFMNDKNVAFAKQWFKDHPDYKIIK